MASIAMTIAGSDSGGGAGVQADLKAFSALGTCLDALRKQLFPRAMGAQAVLMKGGHGTGADCVDLLVTDSGIARLPAPRIATRNTHGTGCTHSAAIAAADRLQVGSGHGPVHPFYAVWHDG